MAEPAYWPWWAGALGLCAAALSYFVLLGRPIGVSGIYGRLIALRHELAVERTERGFEDATAMRAALVRETLAEMREAGIPEDELQKAIQQASPAEEAPSCSTGPVRVPLFAQLAFLGAMVAGSVAAAASHGHFALRFTPEALHQALYGGGVGLALLGGGVLVGFGTRLAGGCTSGHGLAGCARLQPGSLVATATFFGTGTLVSLALARWLL